MVELEKNIIEKVSNVFKEEFGEDFELNYNITDDKISFFVSINEGKELSQDNIDKVSSIIDGSYEGSNLVNQEYRYEFNLKPCSD